ncbi:cytochrome P450 [Streptomyces sp. CJ_13]|uniref:cytochrome P450 family protein n=1 Tax=Streptomyces sp. CJ_13 TaxID=2724943 RepID=UPI001BDCDB97|nr:cytochrome P450 [Streptomyces sp. CJ_13]MBT1184748.1 cytochrome P450 [Streptomyces sp. CJ_13]
MTHDSATPLAQPFGPDFLADPHAVFARLREKGSAHRLALPDGAPVWLVTHERDVRRGLADPRFSVDKQHSGSGFKGFSLPPALDANLLNLDAGDHLRLRRLVAQGFTPRHVDGMRNHIQSAVDLFVRRLLGRLEADGQADLVAEFARPLPLKVIGDLFVVPAEEQELFSEWISSMLSPTSGDQLVRAIGNIHQYLIDLVASRRASPGNDILSGLIAARDEDDRLTEDELVSLAFLILGAGSESVQHHISNAVVTLLDHPDQLSELREEPGLLPAAVEELLRYAHPNLSAIRRFPTEPVDVGEARIPAGDTVLFSLASAHRDPARYPQPDRFDIHRLDKDHLALGHGLHYCLGAALARTQIALALDALLRRLPGLRLASAPENVRWRTTFRFRAPRDLPVMLDQGAPTATV